MSTVYANAIAMLERDRGALQGQLDRIDLALTSLRDLDGQKADERSVGRSVGTRTVPTAREAKDSEGDSRAAA